MLKRFLKFGPDNDSEIFLDDKSFHCLKRAIPAASRAKLVIEEAVNLKFFGSSTVISCNEAEARNLLAYARHCPGVVASINRALLSAGLALEKPRNIIPNSMALSVRIRERYGR
jgi:hypothetical protein